MNPEVIAELKALAAAASRPPMALAPLSVRRDVYQLATLHPGGAHIAQFRDGVGLVATVRAQANAEFVKACYEHVPALLDALEELQREREDLARQLELAREGRERRKDRVATLSP